MPKVLEVVEVLEVLEVKTCGGGDGDARRVREGLAAARFSADDNDVSDSRGALMRLSPSVLLATSVLALPTAVRSQPAARSSQSSFTISQIKSYPFPSQLTASATGSRIAWTLNEQGRRNVWVAEGPAFSPRRLTSYLSDDGQDLTSVSLSADGK